MDDIYEYRSTEDDSGLRFRSCIWESSRTPVGYVKWCIEFYEPEIDMWYRLEHSHGGVTFDVALEATADRLKWWATNYVRRKSL